MTHETLQEIVCSLGFPVAGNPTQYVMEKCFEAAGCDWRCLTLEVEPDDFAKALHGAKALGFVGAAIAPPFLQEAVSLVDEKTPVVEIGDLVNCVVIREGKLYGENTEAAAVAAVLPDLKEKRIIIAGAEGRSRAIAALLATMAPQKISIFSADEAPAQALATRLSDQYAIESDYQLAESPLSLADADILIQTGGEQDALLFDLATIPSELTVVDLDISPRESLRLAVRQAGAELYDGLTIAANLHAINYRLWTNAEADVAMIRETLEEYLGV
ncbi:MAG: shikimate dehydrogenase family protein [Blastopirellula sp. JB062]